MIWSSTYVSRVQELKKVHSSVQESNSTARTRGLSLPNITIRWPPHAEAVGSRGGELKSTPPAVRSIAPCCSVTNSSGASFAAAASATSSVGGSSMASSVRQKVAQWMPTLRLERTSCVPVSTPPLTLTGTHSSAFLKFSPHTLADLSICSEVFSEQARGLLWTVAAPLGIYKDIYPMTEGLKWSQLHDVYAYMVGVI